MPKNDLTLSNKQSGAVKVLMNGGSVSNNRYVIEASRPNVQVRDLVSGYLLAYSCLRSSFEEAIEEFVRDYYG